MTRARELRFVVVVDDHDVAAHLFGDVFDLRLLASSPRDGLTIASARRLGSAHGPDIGA
jgi:hypothetical protein